MAHPAEHLGLWVCPGCGYDRSAAPTEKCPECGTTDPPDLRDADDERPDPPWADALLAAAVLLGLVGYAFSDRSHAQAYSLLWFGVVWALAFGWVGLRLPSIRRVPAMSLWLVLIATVAPNRPDLKPPLSTMAQIGSAGVAVAAVVYAASRAPRMAAMVAAYVVALLSGFSAAVLLVFAAASVLGIAGGGSYHILNVELRAGGINDAIAVVVAVIFGGVSFYARRLGKRLQRE